MGSEMCIRDRSIGHRLCLPGLDRCPIPNGMNSGGFPHPLHLSLSYGLVSGPCRSAAYNLLIAGTYAHHGRASPGDFTIERFWRTKVVPGLAWSVLRDSGSVGGGIVVAPYVVPRDASPPVKFLGGLGCGACCGRSSSRSRRRLRRRSACRHPLVSPLPLWG